MKTLLLIDANSLIHRCFHALPPLTNPKGEPVGALYGVSNILLKIISAKKPEYAAACFDRPEPTFRKEKFSDYKIHRPKTPDELVSQLSAAHDLFKNFSIIPVEQPGYEADDIIGTLAEKFKKEKDIKVTILTGDLDSLQLIQNGKVIVDTFKKGISDTIEYDEEKVFERYGLKPEQLIDYKALVGDPSDNIPGVAGVGPKTASEILRKYKTLDEFIGKGKKEKAYEKIKSHEKEAFLSRDLATIVRDVSLKISLNDLEFSPDTNSINIFFDKNGFASLLKRIPSVNNLNPHPQENSKKSQNSRQKEIFKSSSDEIILTSQSVRNLSGSQLSSSKTKIGFDLKGIYKLKHFSGPLFDVLIALQLMGTSPDDFVQASQKLFKETYSEEEFDARAFERLSKKIEEKGLEKVMYEIEMPLLPVIARMEENGVLTDADALNHTDKELSQAVKEAQERVSKIVGKSLNPNSPKQLLDYFQKTLGLKINSTSAETIEKIKEKNPLPIFDALTAYRELFKLKTTYIDAFKKLVSSDGRIHPTFLQLGAATGRLSCQNPNLQNIPQESEWSPKIRNVFVAPKSHSLVSFDYSQIELRVLATVTGDKRMIETFQKGGDIHAATAEKIFGVTAGKVTFSMRRLAKTLNFGMMYGMGFRAFSQNAKIPAKQAKEFIKKYFEQFPAIKIWEQKVLEAARRDGLVTNLNGRYRELPYINSTDQRLVSESERAAKNMPSQSLAADILKLAMIKVDGYIQKDHPDKIKMILSIHDELVFEINNELLTQEKESGVVRKIKSIMDSAYEFKVPLKVDCKIGKRWGEMK